MDFSKIKEGDKFWYPTTKVIVQVLKVENNITGAPFFGQTVWFLPLTRNGSYPFSLPKSILGNHLEAVKPPELTHK